MVEAFKRLSEIERKVLSLGGDKWKVEDGGVYAVVGGELVSLNVGLSQVQGDIVTIIAGIYKDCVYHISMDGGFVGSEYDSSRKILTLGYVTNLDGKSTQGGYSLLELDLNILLNRVTGKDIKASYMVGCSYTQHDGLSCKFVDGRCIKISEKDLKEQLNYHVSDIYCDGGVLHYSLKNGIGRRIDKEINVG